ncbi:MAG: hypothetical protein ACE5JU_20565, partial [Candidatus Binatia bacterium]
ICIGSDQSPALSSLTGPGQPTVRDAVAAAFHKNHSLSAAIVVRIKTSLALCSQFERQAHRDLFINPHAKESLTEKEAQALYGLNFNRWKYTYPLEKWDRQNKEAMRRVTGSLIYTLGGFGMEIEIPANILVDALAEKTSLAKEYDLSEDDPVAQALNAGWVVEVCSLKSRNMESGEAPKVVLGMVPPPFSAYWPEKK